MSTSPAAGADAAQVHRGLQRHLSGLELSVGSIPDAAMLSQDELRFHRIMLSRLEGTLLTWKRKVIRTP